jgi:tRNA(Ile)-lysidine synthetase-like protein
MHFYKYMAILQNHKARDEYKEINELQEVEQLNEKFSKLNFDDNLYCISLSGGLDSMVLMDILHNRGKQIIAIHINYNNRPETKLEEDFLRTYCQERNIQFICHSFDVTRGSIKRSEYETMTKKIKFDLYKKILFENNLTSILLAHHKDDIIENIFTNFCRGDNFLNLSVIKESNTIMGVNIVRPLIEYYKQDIYDYAHFYKVPYFLDTTPDWSVRGKFRNIILKQLFNTFAGLKTNLLSIAKESDEWGSLIQEKFINKYIENISFGINQIIMPIIIENGNKEDYSEYPMCFWSEIMAKVFHRYEMSAPSRKSLEIFINALRTDRAYKNVRTDKTKIKILLKHGTELIIQENFIKINLN